MNRGVLESSSPVQPMMGGGGGGGSPNWWSMIHTMRPPIPYHHHNPPHLSPPPFLAPLPTHFPSPPPPAAWTDHSQDHLHESWSQLILGGLVGEEEKCAGMMMNKQMESWEAGQHLAPPPRSSREAGFQVLDIKHDTPTTTTSGYVVVYGGQQRHGNSEFPAKSCLTSLSSNMLDFSNKSDARHSPQDHSSECVSTAATTGGGPATKKPRIQPSSSTQSTFKVRKEKLGDRITALHQLVSPFGKTDTASVLLEAIGYIRFLQSQIEALSMPYLGRNNNGLGNNMRHPHQSLVQAERNCLFPEDPGQLLNDNCMKRKGTSGHHHQQQSKDSHEEAKKDLRSKGLCLVPISCTLQVGSDNIGADYWAPAAFGGGFRP
ncbi:hypothetical protein DM860_004108 [Cuscuta australis]|uniref:BHLH domain-containing protein n=1 Tax=Cuscuta australis TaxID=267555 RepID=A0A328CW06_9ASTE|nr:hypothetical protein DM860_004108 [Cuscuta australis]